MCMFSRSLFALLYIFFLAIALSVPVWYTDYDYLFDVFKLLLNMYYSDKLKYYIGFNEFVILQVKPF